MKLIKYPEKDKYDAIVLAVAHDQFKDFSYKEIMAFGKDKHVIYDIKYLLNINNINPVQALVKLNEVIEVIKTIKSK